MHPLNRTMRRKINHKLAKKRQRIFKIFAGIELPKGKFVKQKPLDCGHPHCPVCHAEPRGKPESQLTYMQQLEVLAAAYDREARTLSDEEFDSIYNTEFLEAINIQ